MQAGGGVGLADLNRLRQQDRAGIEAGLHLLDLNPGLSIAGHDGTLDRCRATPARQQGAVQVEAAKTRRIKRTLWQDLPEGDDNRGIKVERLELIEYRIILKADRGGNRNPQHFGQLVHRRFLLRLAAPALARRLGIDAHDLVARCGDLGQRADSEIGCSHEGEAKRHARCGPVKINRIIPAVLTLI